MAQPGFWDDPKEAQKVAAEASRLREQVSDWQALRQRAEDLQVLFQLAVEEQDGETAAEAVRELASLDVR